MMKGFTGALLTEILLNASYLEGEVIETIYFGGGSPSILPATDIAMILDKLHEAHEIAPNAEITIEANPDDVDAAKLKLWKETGVNRFSLGVQSFNDRDLQWLGRTHDAAQALRSIDLIKQAGFENFSIDLIYGIPGQQQKQWEDNVRMAVSTAVPHISAYALTVEPGTILDNHIRKGSAEKPDDGVAALHFETMMAMMADAGFLHYEISNFCLPGFYSRHNTAYWQGIKYLGLGPSAHSYNGSTRQWNINAVKPYVDAISNGVIPCETETLSTSDRFNEYVMISLRTMWGCSLTKIATEFGAGYTEHLLTEVRSRIQTEDIILDEDVLYLSAKGKLFADSIASGLFV